MLNQPFLKWSTVTYMVAPFAGGVALVLSPLYAQHILAHSAGLVGPLRSGAFRFSVLEVSIGVGALLVSGLAPRLAHRWPRGRLFAVGVVGMGIVIAPLALTSSIYVAAALMAASGFFNSLFFISGTTLVQTLTPTELRGRVVSILLTVSSSSLALGSAAGGVLLLALPYATLWLVLGGMIAGASLFVLLQPDARAQL
jgi:MFS family permease